MHMARNTNCDCRPSHLNLTIQTQYFCLHVVVFEPEFHTATAEAHRIVCFDEERVKEIFH